MVDEYETPAEKLRKYLEENYGDPYVREVNIESLFRDLSEALGEDGWRLIAIAVREEDVDYGQWYYIFNNRFESDYVRLEIVGLLEYLKSKILEGVDL